MLKIRQILRKKFIDYLVKDLFVVIDERDLFYIKDGIAYFGGKEISIEDRERLRIDAERFHKSYLWNIISRRLKWEGTDKIANKSQTIEDIIGGKIILYITKVIDNTLDEIKR